MKITPSQEKALQRIREYFDGSRNDGRATIPVTKWKTELSNGLLCVTIETGYVTRFKNGGFFVVGRRGGIKMLSTVRLGIREKDRKKELKRITKILRD